MAGLSERSADVGVPVWVEGRRLRLAIGCDMMVHPAFRGLGGAERMIASFRESGHGFDMNFGTVNSGSRHVTARHVGTVAMRRVPVWARVAAHMPEGNAVVRAVASAPDRLYGSLAGRRASSLEVVELGELGAEVDELARDSARFAPCIRIRDAAYLRWRWLEDPRMHWSAYGVWGHGRVLRGVAVTGVRVTRSARTGVIGDVLARDAATLRALLHDAWERLSSQGCHRVICAYHDPRPWGRLALIRSVSDGLRSSANGLPAAPSPHARTTPSRASTPGTSQEATRSCSAMCAGFGVVWGSATRATVRLRSPR